MSNRVRRVVMFLPLVLAGCSSTVGRGDAHDEEIATQDHVEIAPVDVERPDVAMDARDGFDAIDAVDAIDTVDAGPRCPLTCESMGATCGTIREACVGTLRCGDACVDAVRDVPVDARLMRYDDTDDTLLAYVGPLDAAQPNVFAVIDPESGRVEHGFLMREPIDAMYGSLGQTAFGRGDPYGIALYDREGLLARRGAYGSPPSPGRLRAIDFSSAQIFTAASHDASRSTCVVGFLFGAASPSPATIDTCPASFSSDRAGRVFGVTTRDSVSDRLDIADVVSGVIRVILSMPVTSTHPIHTSYWNGTIFATNGQVIDVSQPTTPTVRGVLPFAGGVAIDEASQLAVLFGVDTRADGSRGFVWRAFDPTSLAVRFDDDSFIPAGPDAFVSHMVSTGPNRFVAIVYPNGLASSAALYILHIPLHRAPPRDAGVDGSVDASGCWPGEGGVPGDPIAEPQVLLEQIVAAEIATRASNGPFGPDFVGPPLTPVPVPQAMCVVDPPGTWAGPDWSTLGIDLSGTPHRYSYSVDSVGSGTGAMFSARAIGDLDGDGVNATFEISVGTRPDGGLTRNDLYVYNPYE